MNGRQTQRQRGEGGKEGETDEWTTDTKTERGGGKGKEGETDEWTTDTKTERGGAKA